ncbi:hypothetical protein KVV02_006210 [Mortierella alpina]|uniref:Uncharacterized protein n=1 Tax=Mortierella alpina TaxID=64518 RepID=A0A9P8AB38_MORAP|nr:hypothetical protein KVV02_006210 [Mortierella alpina]
MRLTPICPVASPMVLAVVSFLVASSTTVSAAPIGDVAAQGLPPPSAFLTQTLPAQGDVAQTNTPLRRRGFDPNDYLAQSYQRNGWPRPAVYNNPVAMM